MSGGAAWAQRAGIKDKLFPCPNGPQELAQRLSSTLASGRRPCLESSTQSWGSLLCAQAVCSKSQETARSLWQRWFLFVGRYLERLGTCPLASGVSLHCHLLARASGAELTEPGVPHVQEGHRAGTRTDPCQDESLPCHPREGGGSVCGWSGAGEQLLLQGG